jgi:hypothetical protein
LVLLGRKTKKLGLAIKTCYQQVFLWVFDSMIPHTVADGVSCGNTWLIIFLYEKNSLYLSFKIHIMPPSEMRIGVIKKPIITWPNSAGREFIWGHVGMTVDIIAESEKLYEVVDLLRGAVPICVPKSSIEKIEIVWKQIR